MHIKPNEEPNTPDHRDDPTGQAQAQPAPPVSPYIPPENPTAKNTEGNPYDEKNYRLNKKQFGAAISTLLVLAVYTGITGYQAYKMRQATEAARVSATAAKDSIDLTRKQMEGVSAATIQFDQGMVAVDFPVPPHSGEARFGLKNVGHVIGHDAQVALSVSIRNANGNTERVVYSGTQTVLAISPSDVATTPNFIHAFQVTDSEYSRIRMASAYIVAEGALGYENGFGTRFNQPFCYAYIWGGQKFGRWSGDCGDAKTEIEQAKAN